MFNFACPWMILLLPAPLLVRRFVAAPVSSDANGPEIRFPYLDRLKKAFTGNTGTRALKAGRLATNIILAVLWVSIVGALMGPQRIDHVTNTKNMGHDLMLAVDLSDSMRALDFSQGDQAIDRLDVSKAVVKKFVGERKNDRVGLTLFGTQAYLRVPLTSDTRSVSKMLDEMQIGEAGNSTAIGDAIGLAVRNLRKRPAQSRVLILLTDGSDNASTLPPLEAAKLAKQYGIRIYTIGVGSNGPVPIPNAYGQIAMVRMDLDENLLKKIAEMTGGSYFRATDISALQAVYHKINSLEKSESEEHSYLVREPFYRYPLALALAMMFALVSIPLSRRSYGI